MGSKSQSSTKYVHRIMQWREGKKMRLILLLSDSIACICGGTGRVCGDTVRICDSTLCVCGSIVRISGSTVRMCGGTVCICGTNYELMTWCIYSLVLWGLLWNII